MKVFLILAWADTVPVGHPRAAVVIASDRDGAWSALVHAVYHATGGRERPDRDNYVISEVILSGLTRNTPILIDYVHQN